MPKSVRYTGNSIIYFRGDFDQRIFILKKGKINITSLNLETGLEKSESVQIGEFFGVKSSLGNYRRDSTARVIQDSEVLVLNLEEFENLLMNNSRLTLKMLKVFSNQLRRIHNQVQALLGNSPNVKAETAMFKVGKYYFDNQKFQLAYHVFNRYLNHYPSGPYQEKASELRKEAAIRKRAEQKALTVDKAAPPTPPSMQIDSGNGKTKSIIEKEFYQAKNLLDKQQYSEAFNAFQNIIHSGDKNFTVQAEVEIGRCFMGMKKYNETINIFSTLIQKYPKHPGLIQFLFYIGQSYEGVNNAAKAISFYRIVLNKSEKDQELNYEAQKALKRLEQN